MKRRTSRKLRSNGHTYYSVHIPYSKTPTVWHPRSPDGPFAVLSRGKFSTVQEAHDWAQERLGHKPVYKVVSHSVGDDDLRSNSRRRTSLRRNGVRSTVDHEASTELKIYVDNTYALYALKTAIEKNLSKKKASGKYDSSKAPKAFLYLADEGAKRYAKEFASPREAFQIFSAATRRDVAARLAKDFEDEYAIVHPNARRRTSRR
jgi:hypothetical protein